MNEIAEARQFCGSGENTAKRLECIVATDFCKVTADSVYEFKKGKALVIPLKTEYSFEGSAVYLALERHTLPFKKITEVCDDGNGGLLFAAEQALQYKGSSKLVLSALGELVAAYLIAFAPVKELSPIVSAVREEILKNVTNSSFALDAYLRSLPLNSEYVRKLFKEQTGITPHKLLIDERMKLAEYILAGGVTNQYTEYSMAQVAEACGISDPLYFSRAFKNYFGVAPSEYRK